MYCARCGKPVKDGEAVCPNCGAPMRRHSQSAHRPAHRSRRRLSSPEAVWIALAALAAVLVLLLAVFFVLKHYSLPPFGGKDSPSAPVDPGPEQEVQPGEPTPGDEYPDTVVISSFVEDPEPFSGQSFALNARVDEINGGLVRARVDYGAGSDVYLSLPSGVETVDLGDNVYVDGVYRYAGGGAGYFENAAVKCTGKPGSPLLRTTYGMPRGIKAQVTDYYKYLGSFSASPTVEEFSRVGGPMVQLTVDGGQLRYTVSNADADLASVAQITGSVPMDGSPEISFYASDDGWGNSVTGKLYLYAGGYVALEAAASGGGEWSLSIPYTDLDTCAGTVPTLFEPAGDCTQELRCVSSGSAAVMTLLNWDHGKWHELLTVDASIGSGGVNYNKREDDKCTPGGTFNILFALGGEDMDLSIPYYRVTSGDVWVSDPESAFYNTYRSSSDPRRDWSHAEDLYAKFSRGYAVASIYFDYNGDGLTGGSARYNGGSALFIDGVGPAGKLNSGLGDIKLTSDDMLRLLPLLEIARNPRIVIS